MKAWMLAVVLGLIAQGTGAQPVKGQAVFAAKCVSCHGKDGKGSAGMAKLFSVDAAAMDLTRKDVLSRSDEDLAGLIAKGSGKMPAFSEKLKPEEIKDVVAYLRGLAVPAKGASGSAEAAKLFQAKCVLCHAKDAKGNPAMAKGFAVDPSALNLAGKEIQEKKDPEISSLILKGKGKMPSFKGKLSEKEVDAIVGYLRSLAGGIKREEPAKKKEEAPKKDAAPKKE
jgi:cytochrome c oxidase cbb3-type subunit 3